MSFVTSLLPSSATLDLSLSSLRKRLLPFSPEASGPRPEKARRTAERSTASTARSSSVVFDLCTPHNSIQNRSSSSSHRGRSTRSATSGVNKQTTRVAQHGLGQERRKPAPLRRHETVLIQLPPIPSSPSGLPPVSALSNASTIFPSPPPSSEPPKPSSIPTSPPRPKPMIRRALASPGPRPAHLKPPSSPVPTASNPYPIIKPRRTRPFVPLCSPLAPARIHFPQAETTSPDLRKWAVSRCMRQSEEGQVILLLGAHRGVMECMARRSLRPTVMRTPAHMQAKNGAVGSTDVEMDDAQRNSGPSSGPGAGTSRVDVSPSSSPVSTSSSSEDWEMIDT